MSKLARAHTHTANTLARTRTNTHARAFTSIRHIVKAKTCSTPHSHFHNKMQITCDIYIYINFHGALSDPLCYSLYLVKMKTQNTHTHILPYTWANKCARICFFPTCHRLTVKFQGKKWHWQSSNSGFESVECVCAMGRLINSNYRFSSELNVYATSQSNDTQSWCAGVFLTIHSLVYS